MKMQISELAKHFNVSVRTLQYYDSIGILKPAETTEKGYRLYDEDSVSEMREILRYKEFGFPLETIAKLLSDKNNNSRLSGLLAQKRKLSREIKRLNSVIADIDAELAVPPKLGWLSKINENYNHSVCVFSHYADNSETFAAWGKADHESGRDFTTSLKFPLGAATTQFAAYCIIRFEELGLLHTSDPIGKYFPELIYGDITIRQLLDMTSGLSNEYFIQKISKSWEEYCKRIGYNDLPYGVQGCRYHEYNKLNCKPASISEIIEAANFAPPKFTAGEKFDYAEINYMLLKIILEKIAQKSFEEILKEQIFTPLEMDNTSIFDNETDVTGYVGDVGVEYYNDIYGGATGMISTVDDMEKWCSFLIGKKFFERYMTDSADFSCGWYDNGNEYCLVSTCCEVTNELRVGKDGGFYISVRNTQPVPDNNTRLMYYPVQCDDGYFKLEVWDMQPNSEVKVFSIKIFDEECEELYSAEVPESGYFISLRNDGGERHAEEFAEDGSYYYEMNLSEILGDKFQPLGKYIVEVKAERPEYSSCTWAKLGMVYKRKSEWMSVQHNVFYHLGNAYDVFMEDLSLVANFLNDKLFEDFE